MKAGYLEEPALEFGGGSHIDIRRGLIEHGPFDIQEARRPRSIRVGLVGTAQSAADARRWLEKVSAGVPAKTSDKPNLFPGFPGFSGESGFRSSLVFDDTLTQALPVREFARAGGEPDFLKRLELVAAIFVDACRSVRDKGADVVVVSYPSELFPLLCDDDEAGDGEGAPDEPDERRRRSRPELHDILKCRCMLARVPIQVIRPATYDQKMKRFETDRRGKARQVQDEATRAWNFLIALYYKAGGIPWRMPRPESALSTCYLGIGFYRSLDWDTLHTSVAQVFNERGYGVVVRGGQVERSDTDRQVHLSRDAIRQLVLGSMKAYRGEHHQEPARLVVHKSSPFAPSEIDGVNDCASELRVDNVDMLSLSHSFIRLFRDGYYPPLRGTYLDLDDKRRLLYTRGTVPFYEEYPGMYVPRSLLVRFESTTTPKDELCTAILHLTKMNWNNCQMDELTPITLRAARQVGDILKYAPVGAVAEHYRYYM
jgi:hypothetical protein